MSKKSDGHNKEWSKVKQLVIIDIKCIDNIQKISTIYEAFLLQK